MKTYQVFRAENRLGGHEDHIGTVEAEDQEQADLEAAARFECSEMHHLYVVAPEDMNTVTVEYSLDSLGDISPSAFEAACIAEANRHGMPVVFQIGLKNRETIDGKPVDLIVETAFAECCRQAIPCE